MGVLGGFLAMGRGFKEGGGKGGGTNASLLTLKRGHVTSRLFTHLSVLLSWNLTFDFLIPALKPIYSAVPPHPPPPGLIAVSPLRELYGVFSTSEGPSLLIYFCLSLTC